MKSIFLYLMVISFVGIVLLQNIDEDNVDLQCPDTEKVYKNQDNQYYCDCAPGNVYFPPTDECFNVYTRGPCSTGKHIVLRMKTALCVNNPCGNQEDFVRYRGKCHKLNVPGGPCPPISEGGGILSANLTTLQLGCWKQDDDSLNLFGNIPEKTCEPGTTRVGNACRQHS